MSTAVAERAYSLCAPSDNPPPDSAPESAKVAWKMNHAQQALSVRIAQLEGFIRDCGLDVPARVPGW